MLCLNAVNLAQVLYKFNESMIQTVLDDRTGNQKKSSKGNPEGHHKHYENDTNKSQTPRAVGDNQAKTNTPGLQPHSEKTAS
jgi:hypothetical protein